MHELIETDLKGWRRDGVLDGPGVPWVLPLPGRLSFPLDVARGESWDPEEADAG